MPLDVLEQSETPISELPAHPISTQFPVAIPATATLSYSGSDASVHTVELLSTDQPVFNLSEKGHGKSPQLESLTSLARTKAIPSTTLSANEPPRSVSSRPLVVPADPPPLVSPLSTPAAGEPSVATSVESSTSHQVEYPQPVTLTASSALSCAAPATSIPTYPLDISPLLPAHPPVLLRSQSLPTSSDNTSDDRPEFKSATTAYPLSPVSPSRPREPLQSSLEVHGQSTLRPEDSAQRNSTSSAPANLVPYSYYSAMLKQAQQKQHWKTQAENCEKLLHGFEKEIISLQQKTRAHISEALEAWTDDDRAKLVDKINALEQENTIQRREIMFLQKNQKYLTSELQSLMDHMTLTFQQHRMEQTTSKRVLQEKEYSLNVVHRLLEEMMGKTRQYDNLREKYRKESAQLKEAMQLSNWNHIIDTIQRMGTDNPF